MQKVVGSSPIIRSIKGPGNGATFAGGLGDDERRLQAVLQAAVPNCRARAATSTLFTRPEGGAGRRLHQNIRADLRNLRPSAPSDVSGERLSVPPRDHPSIEGRPITVRNDFDNAQARRPAPHSPTARAEGRHGRDGPLAQPFRRRRDPTGTHRLGTAPRGKSDEPSGSPDLLRPRKRQSPATSPRGSTRPPEPYAAPSLEPEEVELRPIGRRVQQPHWSRTR
jgi:hypothetical protein